MAPSPQLVVPTLIGMVAVIVLHQQINRTFWGVLGELQAGTFERLYLSPVPPPVLMIARQTSTAIQAIAVAAILSLLTIVPSALAWDLGLALDLSAIQVVVPALAAIVGGAGVSLAVAGLTLLLRRLEIFIEMIFAAATVFGGVLVPLHELSAPLEIVGRAVLPIAQPIAYARRILIDGRTLATDPGRLGSGLAARPAAAVDRSRRGDLPAGGGDRSATRHPRPLMTAHPRSHRRGAPEPGAGGAPRASRNEAGRSRTCNVTATRPNCHVRSLDVVGHRHGRRNRLSHGRWCRSLPLPGRP